MSFASPKKVHNASGRRPAVRFRDQPPVGSKSSGRDGGHLRMQIRLEPKVDYWGRLLPRYVPDDILRRALLRRITADDGFLVRALSTAAGSLVKVSDIRSAVFDHFQEGDFQMVFRVRVELRNHLRPIRLCVLVSKGNVVSGRIAAGECRLLSRWSRKAPDLVVGPLADEWVPVPSYGGEPNDTKRLFVYVTPWLTRLHELGVTHDLRFFVNEHPVQRFPAGWTDLVKSKILSLCLALYDPGAKEAIAPPLIGAGDIMINRPRNGQQPRVKLIAARGIRKADGPAACLRIYLDYAGEWGGRRFTLAPTDPVLLRAAVMEGLVQRNAFDEATALGLLSD